LIFIHQSAILSLVIRLRHLTGPLREALKDTPVVFLNGARQTGKSTVAKSFAERELPAKYLTFDDPGVLAAALDDPGGFLESSGRPLIIDEVQRAPDLFLALKAAVDRDRKPGRFLLTGSANLLLLPRLAQSLVGRMQILTLWPFSQGELENHQDGFVDAAFGGKAILQAGPPLDRADLLARMLKGGFPEAVSRNQEGRRMDWFASYVATLLQRDVRDLANVESLEVMPRLLSLIAARTGGLLNYSEFSRDCGLPVTTLKRYVALLEATYLVQPLPAWSRNLGKRLVRASKLYLSDSGLLAYLLHLNEQRLEEEPNLWGPLLENFVVMELRKQITWSRVKPQIFHYRSHAGQEVDIILEDRAGRVVGIEVKSRMAASGDDFRALRDLAAALGNRFLAGIVLYTGANAYPFGPRMYALPVSALWLT
jgi:hypothetical protein